MKTLSKLVSTSSVSLLVITSPVLISSNHKKIEVSTSTAVVAATYHIPVLTNSNFKNFKYTSPSLNAAAAEKLVAVEKAPELNASAEVKKAFEVKMVIRQALTLYDSMKLDQSGLNQKAFEYAWRGYHNLLKTGMLKKTDVLTVCDFTQKSSNKRLYVIDVLHKKLLFNTYVSHGMNSGVEYASSFSNKANSFKSSLGFFITSKTYFGRNGLSLKVRGLEKGYNDLAAKRHHLQGNGYRSVTVLTRNIYAGLGPSPAQRCAVLDSAGPCSHGLIPSSSLSQNQRDPLPCWHSPLDTASHRHIISSRPHRVLTHRGTSSSSQTEYTA